ncbi:MAG: NifB/NifX family molybdenum-iron cluster-binding protein [Candidatus Baldrarchaeia archaeon]
MTKERIVVATQGPGGLDDYVSPIFGRCPTYTVVDVENGKIIRVTVQQNTAMASPMGAGIQAAQIIANLGANIVIAGNFGPNAFTALTSLGIKVMAGIMGVKVRDAIEQYIAGKLQPIAAPTAPMHIGLTPPMARPPVTPTAPTAPAIPLRPQISKEMEIQMLENQKKLIEKQLKTIEERIKELKAKLGKE